jgi:hypothetical protein
MMVEAVVDVKVKEGYSRNGGCIEYM